MAHFVYIVTCVDGTLYTGYTTDVARRITEHNGTTTAAKYTRGRRPVKLFHSEKLATRGHALRREAEIKKMSRVEKLNIKKSLS